MRVEEKVRRWGYMRRADDGGGSIGLNWKLVRGGEVDMGEGNFEGIGKSVGKIEFKFD